MGISHDIISEFVKITNDKKEKPKEETVYATIVQTSDGKYVKLDGSDLITPTETTTDIEEGERVTVLIKDHSAIITGNISSPSASVNRVNGIVDVVSEKLGVFEHIVADKIDVNELNAYKITVEHLIAGKAEIEDLKATRAEIGFLDADVAHIKTLVNGNLTSDNILSFNITADKVTMADAFIKDAMVDTINAAKINAGRINTNNVVIGSDDGGMLISGATQQFTDKDGKVRIQIGRDSTGDFTFVLYGEDGTGQLINQNGITASAVSDGLIVNDMINNNAAISGGKLDISSVIFEINNENDTAIHSSKIYLDEQNQSLEVAFNSLKTQVDTIVDISISGDLKAFTEQIQSNTAKIEMNKSSINTLVSEDAIIRKEVSDLEGNLVETTNTLSSKYTSLKQSMDGFKLEAADVYATKSTVKDLENNLTTNYTTTEAMNSAIIQKADEIASTVAKVEIQNMKIGGTNLLSGTKILTGAGINGQIVEKYKGCDVVHQSNNNGSGYKDVLAYGGLILEPSTEYTLSFWAKGCGFITSYLYPNAVEFGYHHNFENRTTNKADGSMNTDLEEGTWKRYAITWKTTPDVSGEKWVIVGRLPAEIPNLWCDISAPKLEKGNKPTDWSESPLEYSTTTEMNSAIQQKADEINLSVSQSINNIQIGGKNLIKNGNFEDGLNHWVYERFTGVTTTNLRVWENGDWCMDGKKQCAFNTYSIDDDSLRQGEWTVRQSFKTVVGQEYTVSYMIAGHRSYKMVAVMENIKWDHLGTKYYGSIYGGKNANDWVYDSITFTATTSESMIWFVMLETTSGTNGHMWFTDVCCVEGNKAQRFIPSLEEYSTTTQMNSAITQNATQIAMTVSKQEVQNMEIGGRNLIKNTPNILLQNSDYKENYNSCSLVDGANSVYVRIAPNVDGNVYDYLSVCEKLIQGEWYTISFEFWNDSGSPVGFYWYPSEHYSKKDYIPSIAGKWQKVSFTYQQTGSTGGGGQSYTHLFGFQQLKAGVRYAYTNLQLERGKIATSWSPSPSDYSTTTQMNSAIQQKADSITSTVSSNYNTLNNKFNNYPTTTQMNSAITQKANEITSKVNMTAIAGVELMPQSHRRNSTSGYYIRTGSGQLRANEWGLFVKGGSGTWVSTDFIAIDPGLPLKYYFYLQNTQGYNPLTYLGFEQYNWKKEEIGENAATIYVLQEKFAGYKSIADTIPENTFNSNTKYIKLRWLVDWDGVQYYDSYLHDISVKQLGSINQSTQIAQMSDKIESTVSSVNVIGDRISTAESKITQNANSIATKVDVNGVKSTIQQNPESVRIGFNGISNYFDLTSARLQVGHSDGSYTQIGPNGIIYYANGSGNRYHCLMKQGWLGQISGTSWSRTITLPSEFKGKTFSVIVSVTEVNAVNTHDVIKHFKVTVPHDTVNYTNGTFVINMSALAYYIPGQQSASAIQTDVSWIAIC